jgi:tRNA A37 threonylcarbamoyltransferase TsaD
VHRKVGVVRSKNISVSFSGLRNKEEKFKNKNKQTKFWDKRKENIT